MNKVYKMIVEIPKGCSNKYEYDIIDNKLKLDRVLYGANFYPGEYGFIDKTLDWDGDPLDVISMITYPTLPGCEIEIRVLGTIKMIDNGEIDTKLFGVVNEDPRFNHIKSINDVPEHIKKEVINFFTSYKALQNNKKVEIKGWGNIEDAEKEVIECQERYIKYIDLLKSKGKKALMEILSKEMPAY